VKDRDLASLLGASVLSGAGSLPLHLMPLIVPVLVIGGRMSLGDAGLVVSAVLLGQLAAALILPVLDIRVIGRTQAAVMTAVLLVGLIVTGFDSAAFLLLGWFVVGMCCGGFQYLGTITAALHSRPAFAFPIRLGVVLCLAGVTAGALQWTAGLRTYWTMIAVLLVAFGLILAIGIFLHHSLTSSSSRTTERRSWGGVATLVALAVVFLLFVGQSGLLAYAIQRATDRGIVLQDASWALAGMKVAAGLVLLLLARKGLQNKQHPRFVELGVLLAASNFLIATTTSLQAFFLGLLALEIAFNLLSARLQAKVSDMAPTFAGQWLVATMLLGAATGPAVHGAALALDADSAFMFFAMASALLPMSLLVVRSTQA
jgi:hypothetical protein